MKLIYVLPNSTCTYLAKGTPVNENHFVMNCTCFYILFRVPFISCLLTNSESKPFSYCYYRKYFVQLGCRHESSFVHNNF